MTAYLDRPDGARIAYEVSGEGPALLFVHGGTGTGAYDWEHQVPYFSRRWRVVVMDLRSHGRSTDPADQLSLDSIAADVEALATALGGVAAVIGFSIGATALLKSAAERPGELAATALVTLGGSQAGNPMALPAILSGGWPPELMELRHVASDDPEHWRALRNRLGSSWAHDMALTAEDLSRIDLPLLVVNGDRDRIESPETAKAIAAAVPGAEVAIISDAGHLAQREQPAAFNEAVSEFLERRGRVR